MSERLEIIKFPQEIDWPCSKGGNCILVFLSTGNARAVGCKKCNCLFDIKVYGGGGSGGSGLEDKE